MRTCVTLWAVGCAALVIAGGAAKAYSRRGHDWTSKYPRIAEAAAVLPCCSAVLDGEAVVQNASGRSDIGELQKTIRQAAGRVIRAETARRPVIVPVVMEL